MSSPASSFKDHRDILLAPVISEKSYGLLDENKYTFLVAPHANKTEIKISVEKVFNVKVTGSTPSTGRASASAPGTATARATAPVARSSPSSEGDRIDIFGGPVA